MLLSIRSDSAYEEVEKLMKKKKKNSIQLTMKEEVVNELKICLEAAYIQNGIRFDHGKSFIPFLAKFIMNLKCKSYLH